ncbi:MAG: GFA family protein [Rhizobiales bacterium]|nr:GFA family protein [Hyphomicrobiales bacterium]
MKVDGECHCGRIAFEAEIDPEKVEICHCADCQTLSGSAFRVVVPTPEEKFQLLRGTPATYERVADSGNKRLQAFCPDCGTPLYSTSVGTASRSITLRVGAIKQRDQLPPTIQYWVRSAQDWVMDIGKLPKVERQ